MKEIGIGIIGGGYMGKAHAVAMSAVGAVFDTNLRPRLEMVCGSSPETSRKYCKAYGFRRAADTWEQLVTDAKVQAVIIASPQSTHLKIASKALDFFPLWFFEESYLQIVRQVFPISHCI